jgi:hypothetical protein
MAERWYSGATQKPHSEAMIDDVTRGPGTRFLELRITVVGAPVPLSRLVLVPSHLSLEDASYVLARLFGHEDSIECFRFERGDEWFGIQAHFPDRPVTSFRRRALEDMFHAPGDVLMYEDEWYFEWRLELRLERIRSIPELPSHKVVVLDGEGATPAGVPNMEEYRLYLAALRDPSSEAHDVAMMTLGPMWNATRFDRGGVQALVDEVPLPDRRRRFDDQDLTECLARFGGTRGIEAPLCDHALELAVGLDLKDPARFARVDRVEIMAAAALRAASLDQERIWPPFETVASIELADVAAFYGVDPAESEPIVGVLLSTERSPLVGNPADALATVDRLLLDQLAPLLDPPDTPEPA